MCRVYNTQDRFSPSVRASSSLFYFETTSSFSKSQTHRNEIQSCCCCWGWFFWMFERSVTWAPPIFFLFQEKRKGSYRDRLAEHLVQFSFSRPFVPLFFWLVWIVSSWFVSSLCSFVRTTFWMIENNKKKVKQNTDVHTSVGGANKGFFPRWIFHLFFPIRSLASPIYKKDASIFDNVEKTRPFLYRKWWKRSII